MVEWSTTLTGEVDVKTVVLLVVLFVVVPLFIARFMAVGGGDRDE